jgi:hypothetical protein
LHLLFHGSLFASAPSMTLKRNLQGAVMSQHLCALQFCIFCSSHALETLRLRIACSRASNPATSPSCNPYPYPYQR